MARAIGVLLILGCLLGLPDLKASIGPSLAAGNYAGIVGRFLVIVLCVAFGLYLVARGKKREKNREGWYYNDKEGDDQRGFVMLAEMLVICCVMVTLAAMALPASIGVIRAAQENQAKRRAVQVQSIVAEDILCHFIYNNNDQTQQWWNKPPQCNALDGQVPVPQLATAYYTYTFNAPDGWGNWSFTATPNNIPAGLRTIYVNQTAGVTCNGAPC